MNTQDLLNLPLTDLDHLSPEPIWSLGSYAAAACLLEASAAKAGNVHPDAPFEGMDYEDFRRSAETLGAIFDRNEDVSCGRLILLAVQATRDEIGKNTNLGIILLLAPLVIAARAITPNQATSFRARWKQAIAGTLSSLTKSDSSQIYQAISTAKPGGLGRVEQMDVRHAPPDDLMVAMRLASQWDDIAKQYATDFHDVFDLSERLDTYRRFESLGWFESLVRLQIERLSSHGDTLIARKNDPAVVDEVKELATKVLHSDFPAGKAWCSRAEWKRLDCFLRADQHQRNPGTTADLLAAAILVSLLCDTMQRSEPHSIP